jgi:hypothetical protein
MRAREFFSRDSNVIFALFLAAILVYVLCLPNQMFWDDEDFILKNMFIKDWQYWPRFFTDNLIAGTNLVSNYWRPLLQTLFAIEWHLWADWVCGWHAVSILCHAAVGAMIFLVINTLLNNRPLAILTALLWIIHPAHTEVVVYPNSMGDSLATLFVLVGIYFYAQFRKGAPKRPPLHNYFIALAMYPLALLSKETGILLIAFIALVDFLLINDEAGTPAGHYARIPRIIIRIWPFILVAAIYMALRATVLNFNNSFNFYNTDTAFTTHFDMRLATFFRVIALDAGFFFTPWDLRVERLIEPAQSFFELDVLWGMALCSGLIWLAIRNWTKRPAVAFGVLWFFTALFPTSNLLVIINAFVYEHFLYVPMIGIILIVLIFAMEWASKNGDMFQIRPLNLVRVPVFWTIIIVLIFAAGIRSAWRCLDWRTSVGFYEKLAPTAPKSYRVFNNMGMAYAEHGQPEKAKETYLKAIALDPNNAVAYHNLANIYRDEKKTDLAQQYYEKALQLQPNFIFSYKSLAQIYLNKNEFVKARRLLEAYVNMSEEKLYILNVLVDIAYREGAYADVKRYLLVLQKLTPNDPNIAAALQKLEAVLKK